MTWHFSDIETMNPPGKGQEVSPLEHLLRVAAASPSLLCEAADRLDVLLEQEPSVACFAQIPFALEDNSRRLVARGRYSQAVFDLSLTLVQVRIDAKGPLSLVANGTSEHYPSPLEGWPEHLALGGVAVTQAIGFVHLWGRRSQFYERYLAAVDDEGLRPGIIIDQTESWDRNRPMNAAQYEVNENKGSSLLLTHAEYIMSM